MIQEEKKRTGQQERHTLLPPLRILHSAPYTRCIHLVRYSSGRRAIACRLFDHYIRYPCFRGEQKDFLGQLYAQNRSRKSSSLLVHSPTLFSHRMVDLTLTHVLLVLLAVQAAGNNYHAASRYPDPSSGQQGQPQQLPPQQYSYPYPPNNHPPGQFDSTNPSQQGQSARFGSGYPPQGAAPQYPPGYGNNPMYRGETHQLQCNG